MKEYPDRLKPGQTHRQHIEGTSFVRVTTVTSDGRLEVHIEDSSGKRLKREEFLERVVGEVSARYSPEPETRDPWILTALPRPYQTVAVLTQALSKPRLLHAGEKIYAAAGAAMGLDPLGYEEDRTIQNIRERFGERFGVSPNTTRKRMRGSDWVRSISYSVWKGIVAGLEGHQRATGTWLVDWILQTSREGEQLDLRHIVSQLEVAYAAMPDNLREEAKVFLSKQPLTARINSEVETRDWPVIVGDHLPLFDQANQTEVVPDELARFQPPNPLLDAIAAAMKRITLAKLRYTQEEDVRNWGERWSLQSALDDLD